MNEQTLVGLFKGWLDSRASKIDSKCCPVSFDGTVWAHKLR